MSRLFLIVLNMSITGGFVALAVIIARLLLKRAPKIFSYALWALVLFRLICPFSFESAVSLILINKEPIPQEIVYMQNPAINTGIKMIDNTVNNSIEESFPPVNQAANVNPVGVSIEIYAIIWLFGITVLLCYGFITYFKLKQRLSIATLVRDNIYETDLIKTAFVMGFIKPKIIIPIYLSENEFDYIIKHEETHIKRFDYIIKPVAFLALIIHWFNPIIWLSYYLMAKDMEMSCDESVVKNTRKDIRVNYSSSLLVLSAKQSGLLSPLAFGEGNVKSRIKNVLNYKKPSFWIMILAIIIIVFILISFGTDPQKIGEQSMKEPPQISINIGDQEIEYVSAKNKWNGSIYDREDTFVTILMEQKDIPIFENGNTVEIIFKNNPPDEFTVSDMLINEDGRQIYTYREIKDIPVELNDGKYSFEIEYHFASAVSSYYEPGRRDIRGLRMIASWGENECEYAFVIKTYTKNEEKASNDGFKVVGSSYFNVEIPSEWDIKPLEYLPIWDIYEGNNQVGLIQMLPYEAEESISESVDDNAIREYLYNEETLRKMNITLFGNYADKSIMDKIKMSFKFTGGPFNVIDLQSTANLYIAGGSKKVFGTINSFDIENGEPTAVVVNVMEFIPDGPNDNNPNGYRIEDLKYRETYTLGQGVNVAALAPPNYTSYEMYYMPLLDENFINNYDYKNFFFDFIVGNDGNLLVVLGHYIP